ncbi:OLC1v1011796C2 [Oldenlandia corymbosa var. corymbosa]|nr:OLC1v1011796C2 [Oldenlandia corymbosa var. corymbosa]
MSEILLRAGASQPACEEALIEASCHGHSKIAERLMASDMIRPQIAVQALVTACCRGYVDLINVLVECGVDVNANTRLLLQSKKPPLHANVDCVPLVAAVVSRQVSAVRRLLEAGARTDIKVQLGAWSWDTVSGEEGRVGAGLAEPYPISWCAVEYFEATGSILHILLQQHDLPLSTTHLGRAILHHAVLCGNTLAVKMLLKCGADVETVAETMNKAEFRSIHIAARLGLSAALQCLIESGCDVNSTTKSGETALMLCVKYRREECLTTLAKAGADFGLVNLGGESVMTVAKANRWHLGFQEAMIDVIRNGTVPKSSCISIFSPLMFVAHVGDVLALQAVIAQGSINLDAQDSRGFSALMITAVEGHVEAFRLLVYAGADLKLRNKSGENAIFLSQVNEKREHFEKVMLEFAIEKGNCIFAGGYPFQALHFAARHGELDAVKLLISRGYNNINSPDTNGYTPLMLAAKEGHAHVCQLLIGSGAQCKLKNANGETALSLARKSGSGSTENTILDGLARELVLNGTRVLKHTKGGKGSPHMKVLKMEGGPAGVVLRWGNSKRRNVVCLEAALGPSSSFETIRQKRGDHCAGEAGLFRVRTKNKEVHFVCEGGIEMAELWVRGIKLVTRGGTNSG